MLMINFIIICYCGKDGKADLYILSVVSDHRDQISKMFVIATANHKNRANMANHNLAIEWNQPVIIQFFFSDLRLWTVKEKAVPYFEGQDMFRS